MRSVARALLVAIIVSMIGLVAPQGVYASDEPTSVAIAQDYELSVAALAELLEVVSVEFVDAAMPGTTARTTEATEARFAPRPAQADVWTVNIGFEP